MNLVYFSFYFLSVIILNRGVIECGKEKLIEYAISNREKNGEYLKFFRNIVDRSEVETSVRPPPSCEQNHEILTFTS